MIQRALLVRRRRRVATLGRLLFLWGWLSVPVRAGAEEQKEQAQQPEQVEGDSAREAEYQQLINYALDEYDRGSWEESAALFRRAHELLPSARTLRGLGLATYEARRYAESVRYLRAALLDKRRPLTDKQREMIQVTLERAKLFVGYLVIDLQPRDAQLMINGRSLEPESDGSFMVDSGWLDIEASASGYNALDKRIRIGGGERQRVVLHLAPESRVTENSSVEPHALPELSPSVIPAQPPQRESRGSSLRTWKWIAGSAAVVALGLGGTMLGIQKAEAPAYERDCNQAQVAPPDCAERHTYLSSTLWTGSIIGLSLGGALTALTVTLFVLDSKEAPHSQPRLACGGTGALGIFCRGQF